jgi:hypothetical protein
MIIIKSTFIGGGNIGSIAILKTFSITDGIILLSKEQDVSRQGLLFTSISQALFDESIMKSKPYSFFQLIWKNNYFKRIDSLLGIHLKKTTRYNIFRKIYHLLNNFLLKIELLIF